ncbi:MAG: alpha/beta hydrolase [Rhizobiaceae bacterium]|nr:alpha/beta hydrolase [Rhizobiaceae bacterium]
MSRCILFDDRFSLESPTGALLNVYRAEPRSDPRGVALLSHGMAEHAGRYARLAGELSGAGIAVYAHDHRGHGSTTAPDAPLRTFAKTNGSAKLVADCHAVRRFAEDAHPHRPVVMLGHSMGGLIAFNYAMRHGTGLAGLSVWNAGHRFGFQERLGLIALKIERMLKGSDTVSGIFEQAATGPWSKAIQPRRTRADWLSHDEEAVDAFLQDPLCSWSPTNAMAADLIALVRIMTDGTDASSLPPSLPLHIVGGTGDPSTGYAKAVQAHVDRLRLAGCRDVTLTIVDGARHETLNEVKAYRQPAMASLWAWLDRVLPNA